MNTNITINFKLGGLAKSIIQFIDYFKQSKNMIEYEEDQKYNLALIALQSASNETRLYLKSIANGKAQNSKKEKELSTLWKTVGFALRGIDSELSKISFEKSDYWLDPESYNLVEIGEINLDLNTVVKEIKLLLQR